jgi:hypothetical protein
MTQRNRPEHDHERYQVCPFYSGLGIDVYATSARVWAKGVTPGIPDLICFWPRLGFHFFHESKLPPNRQSIAQHNFAECCIETGVPYVLGGIEEAMQFAVYLGIAVSVGPTVQVKQREKWPTVECARRLIQNWPWSVCRTDALETFGHREAA